MTKSRDIRFRKTKLSTSDQIEIDPDSLILLMAIDESKPLLQIAREVNLSKKVIKDTILKLYRQKLIEKVEEEVEGVNESFLQDMKGLLVDLLGPLGEILMLDAAEQLGVDYPSIPRDQVEQYVINVAEEIPGDKQQHTFKRRMLEIIGTMD